MVVDEFVVKVFELKDCGSVVGRGISLNGRAVVFWNGRTEIMSFQNILDLGHEVVVVVDLDMDEVHLHMDEWMRSNMENIHLSHSTFSQEHEHVLMERDWFAGLFVEKAVERKNIVELRENEIV